MDIEKKVKKIVQEALGLDRPPASEAKFISLNIDSLDKVEIVFAVEEAFHIDLIDEEAETCETVGQLDSWLS